ncbi:MAG: hypothetical protein SGBAC_006767 [Bacillariaceae sp.]
MSSKRQLPAKKRPVCDDIDYYSVGSSVSSSASSASFNMEEDSSDEELDDEAFQIKPMNSQETNLTASSQLCTQPIARPAKKRKVSVSPQDSLAKKARPKSPPSIIMMEGASCKQAIPLLNLDDSHPTKPNSKPAAPLPSKLSSASRVHAAVSEANKEATTAKRARKLSPKKQSYDEENEVTASTLVTPKEKSNANAKKAQASRQSIAKSKAYVSKTAATRKTPSANTTPRSKASPDQGSLVVAIETPDAKAAVKHKDTGAKKKTKLEEKKAASKAELKPKAESIKKKKKTFQDQLLHHVFFSGRPHTVKDLTQHLKTSEASVNFCLLSLVDKGWIIKKEFTSKSRSRELYWANDDSKNKELMAALDMVAPHEVAGARVNLATLQQQEKATAMELYQVMQEPSNEELNKRVATAENEVASLHAEVDAILKRISAGEQTGVPKQQLGRAQPKVSKARSNPKRIKVEINRMRGEWKKRKEKCNDFIECLADGMEKKAKVVIKLLELETDEDAGVKMPPSYEIKK